MPLSQEELDLLQSGLGSPDTVYPAMDQAYRRNPDQYAETLRLSKSQNLPTDTVERNQDEVARKERLKLLDLDSMRQKSPSLTEYLSNPDNASLSSDDVDNLAATEDALTRYKRPWWDMRTEDWEGFGTALREGFMQSGRGTKQQVLDAKRRRIEETIAREKKAGIPPDEMTYSEDYLQETLQTAEKNVESMRAGQGVVEKYTPKDLPWMAEAARAGAQSVVENLPGLALTLLTRKPVFGLANIGGLTYGRAYGEATVEGMSPEDRAKFAVLKTGVEVGTEVGPLNILASMVGTKTFARKVGQFAITELLGEQAATGLETVVENVYDIDDAMAQAKTFEEKVDLQFQRQLLTFGATLFGGGGQIAIASGANYLVNAADKRISGDIEKTGQFLHEQRVLDAAIELSQSSETRTRAPEQYTQFLQSVDGDTKVTIPAEAIEGLEGLPEYIVPGQDNEVGIELFMRDIASVPEVIEQIRSHIKINPVSYSQIEMEQDDRANLRKIMERAVKSQESLTEAQQIWAQVKDQLVATERQSEVTAKMSAQLYPAFATVMSEKLRSRGHDISPAQVFQDMGFKVGRMEEQVSEADELEQAGTLIEGIDRVQTVSPDTLTFREESQQEDNLDRIRTTFDEEMPPLVTILEDDGGRNILDGHHRTTVAMERGLGVKTVDISRREYEHLQNLGYDDMEISYAALEDAGDFQSASYIDAQFAGAGVMQRGTEALSALEAFNEPLRQSQIRSKRTVTLPVQTIETGEVTEETFDMEEISAEINGKLDAYQQLLDCLSS
jgi:hypothetical protein